MIGPLTYLDGALIAVAFISALLAMYRGLAREILSILSWAAAGGALFYFLLYHKELADDVAKKLGTQPMVAQVAIGAVIFLIVLIIVHLITARISDAILDSPVGVIDRVLGFIFGVARGFILIAIPYMFYSWWFPDPAQHLPWIRDAKSLPYIQATGSAIHAIIEPLRPRLESLPPMTEPEKES